MIFKRFPLQRKKPELCLFVNMKCLKAISSVKTKIFKTLFLNVPALFISFLGGDVHTSFTQFVTQNV